VPDEIPTIYSLPQRIIHTIAVRICGEPVQVNGIVNDRIRDVVIPDILVTIDAKLHFEESEEDMDWREEDETDRNGKAWKHIVIDGGLVIERHRGMMRRIADTLVARVSEFDIEEIEEFEWGDEEDDPIGSLRMEGLLLPYSSAGEDAGKNEPIERIVDLASPDAWKDVPNLSGMI